MAATTQPHLADAPLRRKIYRLASGGKPRVLDLFSGAGGISLGFHRAGFQIEAALEIEPLPALTHALNFHGHDPDVAARHAAPRDMTIVEPEQLAAELGLGPMAIRSATAILPWAGQDTKAVEHPPTHRKTSIFGIHRIACPAPGLALQSRPCCCCIAA
jgi:hypothetical protein